MNSARATIAAYLFVVLVTAATAPAQQSLTDDLDRSDTGGEKRVDLDVTSMDVENVLKIISDVSGWTIIPSPKIRGKASLWSKGATARQLLDKLTLVNDYVYRQQGNVIFLLTADEYEQLFGPDARTYSLRHQKAQTIKPLLQSSLTKNGTIAVDPSTNTVVVCDNPHNLEKIESIVKTLDESLVSKVFTLQYALAGDIKNAVAGLVDGPEAISIEPRTNQIVVSAGKLQMDRLESLIKQLDRKDAYHTRTYALQHAPASHVAGAIRTFVGGPPPQQQYRRQRQYQDTIAGVTYRPPASTSHPIPQRAGPTALRSGIGRGSAPGLAASRSQKTTAVTTTSKHPPASPPPSGPLANAPQQARTPAESLGVRGTVVADDRSNTVTITETLDVLSRIRQMIEQLDVPVQSYSYTIKHRRLDQLELNSKLEALLRPEQDTYLVDSQTHSLNFITIPSIADRLLKMLDQWDRPPKQALINAKILAVNTGSLKDIGINVQSVFDIDDVDVLTETSLPSQIGADRFGSLTVSKLTGTEYRAVIRAIQSDSKSHVLAAPRILALDGQPAEVRMATDEPFTETSLDAENGRILENVRFLQVGSILQVTPTIREDDTIEMLIALDVSSLVEIRNGIPVVNHNIASSTVVVKNNSILMIGGLRFKRTINVKEQVPILGDLPLIGALFRSNRNEIADTELILLLKPTIVTARQDGDPLSKIHDFEPFLDWLSEDDTDVDDGSSINALN
jgi:type II secretory pathway component GspD/PulD (secretin)